MKIECVGCKYFKEANHFKAIDWPFFWRSKATHESLAFGLCKNHEISHEANGYTFADLKLNHFCHGDHFTPQTATER